MPCIKWIDNPLKPQDVRTEIVPAGTRLRDIVPKGVHPDTLWIVWKGKRWKSGPFIDTFVFAPEDQVIIRRFPAGAELLGSIVVSLIVSLIMTGIGFAIQALLPPMKVENRPKFDSDEESPIYGWDGIQNTTRNGTPIPIIYGKHKAAGQILSSFTKAVSDGKSELWMLIGLSAGPVGAISGQTTDVDGLTGDDCEGLKINGTDASAFDGISVSYRMGNWDQAIIPGFADQITQIDQNIELSDTAYTYTTSGSVQAVELVLRFPSGLYQTDARANFLPYEATFQVRYKPEGGSWSSPESFTVSAQTRSQYNYNHRIELPAPAAYDIEITKTSPADDQWKVSTAYLIGVKEINYDDVAYKGVALAGIKAIASAQLHGSLPTVTNIVYGKEVKVYQPGDEFGEDTQQDFTGDGKKYWGWYSVNTDKVESASSHSYSLRTLSVVHKTEASAWDTSDRTAPYFYKRIYGTFDCQVKGSWVSDPPESARIGLLVQSSSDGTLWVYVALKRTASGWEYEFVEGNGDSQTTIGSGSASSDHCYFRLMRNSNGTITGYIATSSDGPWTNCGTTSVTLSDSYHHLGPFLACPTAPSFTVRANFESYTFNDEEAYSIETSSNPAWVLYDLLTDTHYGIGDYIEASQVDLDSFRSFATYCNELVSNGKGDYHRRHRFDGVVDASRSAWEQLLRIAENARAILLKQGDKIKIAWQAPRDPVQLFAVSNIKKGSFVMSYQTHKNGPNFWEIQFLNAENDYEQDFVAYVDPELEAGEPYRRKTIQKYGITRPAEALREAKFLALANRHVTTSIAFETGIEAILCEPNDVILVQHDVPQWGHGGRVESASSTTITLDQYVTLEEGKTYQVTVRHSNDEIETRTVTNSAGRYKTLNISPAWDTTPQAGDVFSFGETNVLTKPFQVSRIERTSDLECRIEAVEYVEDIYDAEIEQIPEITYTELPDPRRIPDDVSNLVATERAQLNKDGTVVNVIDVTFSLPADAAAADIFWKKSDASAWIYAGRTHDTKFTIVGDVAYGQTYVIAVASVGPWDARKEPADCPQASITIQGKQERPPDVQNLRISRVGDVIYLRWDPVDIDDLAGYEIRYGGGSWRTATILGFVETKTEFITTNFSPGSAYFFVKARNTSGIYSENAAWVSYNIPERINKNIVLERDEKDEGWDGTKVNMTVDASGNLVLDEGETEGSYTTPEMDAGATVRSRTTCLVRATQIDRSLTWEDATFTWGSDTAQNTSWEGSQEESHVTVTIKFRYGDSTPLTGDWEDFVAGEYTYRYLQMRVEVSSDSTQYGVQLEGMNTQIDVPDIFCSGENISVAASGTTSVSFADYGETFNVTPQLVVTVTDGAAGDTAQVLNVTTTGFEVRVYDWQGVQKAGTISFVARGY